MSRSPGSAFGAARPQPTPDIRYRDFPPPAPVSNGLDFFCREKARRQARCHVQAELMAR